MQLPALLVVYSPTCRHVIHRGEIPHKRDIKYLFHTALRCLVASLIQQNLLQLTTVNCIQPTVILAGEM